MIEMDGTPIPVFIINLPEERSRYDRIMNALAPFPFLSVTRVDGVRGSLLPDLAATLLTRNKWSVNHKGTLGCFLSHVRAWELAAAAASAFSLILEDDVSLENTELLRNLTIPSDADLVFCNDRTCYASDAGTICLDGNGYVIRPFVPVLEHLLAKRQANGGDGYILTPQGARKLLAYVETDSFFGHVDVRMATYSVTLQEAEPYAKSDWQTTRNISAMRRTYPEAHKLRTYTLAPPIVRHGTEQSRRAREDRLGVSEKAR